MKYSINDHHGAIYIVFCRRDRRQTQAPPTFIVALEKAVMTQTGNRRLRW